MDDPPDEVVEAAKAAFKVNAFTCPRCARVSHNPHDLEEGYCGYCHDWTGPPYGVVWPFVRRSRRGDTGTPRSSPRSELPPSDTP